MPAANVRSIKSNPVTPSPRDESHPFADLQGTALADFQRLGQPVRYSRGEILFQEGDASAQVVLLTSGKVKLSVTSSEGRTMILRIASAGDILGLNAVFAGTDYELTAEALEPCIARSVPAREFMQFLHSHPQASMEVTRMILREYKAVFNDICRLTFPTTVAGRVANLLLEWRHNGFHANQARDKVVMALTQEEIAGMTGTSRETISRTLQQFKRDNLIRIKGSSVTLLQPEALQEMAI